MSNNLHNENNPLFVPMISTSSSLTPILLRLFISLIVHFSSSLFMDFAFVITPLLKCICKPSAEVPSSVPKHKKDVIFFTEKTCVRQSSFRHELSALAVS